MSIRQEIQELRAIAEEADRGLRELLSRLNELEGRVLKDTDVGVGLGQRVRFNNGPKTVLSVLGRAASPMTRAQLLAVILMDFPELGDDKAYAQRAVRNALQVLRKEGKIASYTPNGRLRETVWWAQGMEMEAHNNGEAAIGGLGLDKHGRVK